MDMERCKKYEEMSERLTTFAQAELLKGVDCINAKELGEVTDMIKDLEEAARNHYEACYYKSVTMAMNNVPSYDEESVMGYNHRHMSNGQFATAGHGHMVRGFHGTPEMNQQHYIDAYMRDPDFKRNMSQYGQAYDNYLDAKRHYTETRSMSDKEMMNSEALRHVHDLARTSKEMWEEADPTLKRQMKEVLSNAVGDMTI